MGALARRGSRQCDVVRAATVAGGLGADASERIVSIEWIDDSIAVSLVAGQQQALMDQKNVYLAGQQLSTGTCKNLIT